MLPDDAGSDICLMAACRNKDTHRNSIAAIIHISTAEFQKIMAPLACVADVLEPGW